MNQKLTESLDSCAKLVATKIEEILPKDFSESKIVESMRYSCLSGGKRIRPFLLIKSAELFNTSMIASLNAAIAIELVHTYSLIHDDLPAMDNDDFRRGSPTNHKKFDEATAILAGDALLTYAFEILSEKSTHFDPQVRCELIKVLAQASGFHGMIGGQMMDLENTNNKLTREQIASLHRLKTGELFMASCEMGAIIGGADINQRNKLRYYAHDLGLAFQIKDDILDHKGDNKHKMNIDAIAHHQTNHQDNSSIVDVIGMDQANNQLELLVNQAKSHISAFGKQADLLCQVCDFVQNRNV